jgi:hypothetical protein
MAGDRKPTLPNFLIVGGAKAGTTSLHQYLSLHPEIFMSRRKELCFFDPKKRWDLGVDWYKSNFDAAYPVNGESSPRYSRYPWTPGVPERIKQVLGAPKFIYILRDPIDRLLSQYTQVSDDWPDARPFSEILPNIENEDAGYLHMSCYYLQITQYLNIFPRSQILVVLNERLNARPKETLEQIFRFVGVDEKFWTPEFERRANVGAQKKEVAPWFDALAPAAVKEQMRRPTWMPWTVSKAVRRASGIGGKVVAKPKLDSETDLRLQDMLKADVASLRTLLGDPLAEWRPYA